MSRIHIENIFCRFEGTPPEELLKLLSYVDKQRSFQNYHFTGTYAPAVKTLFSRRSNSFPTGLLPLVQDKFPEWEYIDKREQEEIEWLPYPEELSYKSGHQLEAVRIMQEKRRGTIDGVTAMGKTFIEAGFAAIFPANTLILCHRREIFNTIVDRCQTLCGDDNVGIIASGKTKIARVVVGMVGSVASRIRQLTKYLNSVEAILVDEAHHISMGSQYAKILAKCGRASFRFGLTGTPYRESGDTIAIFAFTGPVIYSYQYEVALADDVVVPIEVYVSPVNSIIRDMPLLENFRHVYESGIVRNGQRNDMIVKIARRLYEKGENVLILVWRKVHGRIISKMLEDVPHCYLHGDSRDRDIERSRFENGDNSVLIASSIYDEGTDITNVRNIIVASAFKSLRITAQRVGRGMRPHEGKAVCRVFDFMDLSHDTLLKHSRKRLGYYKKMKFTIKELVI